LAFAGVHQLCAPMLDRLERLAVPAAPRLTRCGPPRWSTCAGRSRLTSDAARLLLSAARRREPLDADSARQSHLKAPGAAIWAGNLDRRSGVREAAEAAPRARPAAGGGCPARPVRDPLDGRVRSGCTDAYASTRAVSRPGHCQRRSRPLALAHRCQTQRHSRPRAVGRRILARSGRSPGTGRPRHGRARAFASRAQPRRQKPPCRRRVDHSGTAGRRRSPDRGGDREPALRVCRLRPGAARRHRRRS